MTYVKDRLSKQLLMLIGVIFIILFISLGVVLPNILIPVAESTIYSRLSEPLKFINSEVSDDLLNTEVAYLSISNGVISTSDNIKEITSITNVKSLVKKMKDTYGKITYKHRTYYYYKMNMGDITKIALANDSYINTMKASILSVVFPIVLGTCSMIGLLLVLWSTVIVKKIEKLKHKIDNIDNPNYNHTIDFKVDDEIKSLGLAIEDMRISLINQEKYRNTMYQNISHDFKTPLTVIKSYTEAVHDGVEDPMDALNVIEEQTDKLENKVHSLLYLNKLDYLKDAKIVDNVLVDMPTIINTEVEKFKFHKKEVKFIVDVDKKSKYYGTTENWETILDNLLSNSMRYVDKEIKITAKQNKIILYNDGPNIDNDFLEGIFTPFRKGIKGEFGLGLSIVKKTLNIMGYDIMIKNENKKGVSFIITKGTPS